MTETIPAMRERHRREIRAAIIAQRDRGVTQTVAADALGMSVTGFNNLIHRSDVAWPIKRQGQPKHKLENTQ